MGHLLDGSGLQGGPSSCWQGASGGGGVLLVVLPAVRLVWVGSDGIWCLLHYYSYHARSGPAH